MGVSQWEVSVLVSEGMVTASAHLQEEQHHRSGRREYHQLGPITNLRGIGIWGPQAQVFYCSSGGEDSGWHLLRTGGHGLFTFIGDSTR